MGSETIIDKISLTMIKDYENVRSLMLVNIPFSIKLTNKAIYSYVFWIIPVGKILLENISSFKVVRKTFAGTWFFSQGIVIKSNEKGKIKQIIFSVPKNKLDLFQYL